MLFIPSALFPCYSTQSASFTYAIRISPVQATVTDISLIKRQGLKDDHLSMLTRFFSLPLWIGPNDRGPL